MSDTIPLSYAQGKMLTYDAAVILDRLAADLRQGILNLSVSGETATKVALPAQAKLEIAFKGKVKPGKSKHKLAIEISWKEKEAPAEETAPEADALPRETAVPADPEA